jgi:hypothetical protein
VELITNEMLNRSPNVKWADIAGLDCKAECPGDCGMAHAASRYFHWPPRSTEGFASVWPTRYLCDHVAFAFKCSQHANIRDWKDDDRQGYSQ